MPRTKCFAIIASVAVITLGAAAGREATAVIGIVDKGLAKGLRAIGAELMPSVGKEDVV